MASITFSAEPNLIDDLNKLVDEQGLNKSKFLRQIVIKELETRKTLSSQKKNSGK
jgi:metal-responsive CopG/Arc/MetJ family transcriptional regulator